MPTGTRSIMSTNSTTKPMTATASVLMKRSLDGLGERRRLRHQLRMEDQAPGPDRDQEHGRYVPRPGERHEGPGRQVEIVGRDVGRARVDHLVEQHRGLDRD